MAGDLGGKWSTGNLDSKVGKGLVAESNPMVKVKQSQLWGSLD